MYLFLPYYIYPNSSTTILLGVRADWQVGSGVASLGVILSSQTSGPRFHVTSIIITIL